MCKKYNFRKIFCFSAPCYDIKTVLSIWIIFKKIYIKYSRKIINMIKIGFIVGKKGCAIIISAIVSRRVHKNCQR